MDNISRGILDKGDMRVELKLEIHLNFLLVFGDVLYHFNRERTKN